MFALEWEQKQVAGRLMGRLLLGCHTVLCSACLPARLPACPPACLPACLLCCKTVPQALLLAAPRARSPKLAAQSSTWLLLPHVQMRWYLDGAQFFSMNSGSGSRTQGWFSTGAGAGPDAPFDRVSGCAVPWCLRP